MKCQHCGHENPDHAKFCASCGQPVQNVQPQETEWYYVKDGQSEGPYAQSAFVQMIENGQIQAETKVWKEGFDNWTDLKDTALAAYLPAEKAEEAVQEDKPLLWFYVDGNKASKGFEEPDFIALIEEGTITPDTYVYNETMNDWTKLSDTSLAYKAAPAVTEPAAAAVVTVQETAPAAVEEEIVEAETEPEIQSTPEPEKQWWYVKNGQPSSPVAQSELIALIEGGALGADSYVYTEGFHDWRKVSDTDLVKYLHSANAGLETGTNYASQSAAEPSVPYTRRAESYSQQTYSRQSYTAGGTQNVYGAGTVEKHNIFLYIVLSVVTCGIFTWWWMYQAAKEVQTIAGKGGIEPGTFILLLVLSIVTCGIGSIPLFAYYFYKEEQALRYVDSQLVGDNAVLLAVIGALFPIVSIVILQDQLNAFADK
jgi:hypothetical protein